MTDLFRREPHYLQRLEEKGNAGDRAGGQNFQADIACGIGHNRGVIPARAHALTKGPAMATQTPQKTTDSALASHYIRSADVDWEPMSGFEGVEMKVLYQDENTGLFTGLFRMAPGACIPLHEHTDIEQTYLLEGTFQDDDGVAEPGDFIWRPAGNRHTAHSPDGCVFLGMFLKPNKFL